MEFKPGPRGISLARRMVARLHPFGKLTSLSALHGSPAMMREDDEVVWSPPYVAYNDSYWLTYAKSPLQGGRRLFAPIFDAVEQRMVKDSTMTLLMLRTGIYDN